jgi:dTDP-glucose 4,6-dehydratase
MLGIDQIAASTGRLFPSDLEEVVHRDPAVFMKLRGARIFVTGGSGFIGRWLLESLLWANESLGLDVHITVLTRDPEGFARRAPHLAHARHVELLRGDIQAFEFPAARIDRVVHLAAETNTQLTNPDPEVYFDVIVGGTRRVLDLVERLEATSLMIVSSGAVYGNQPLTAESLSEDDPYAPLPTRPGAAYGEAKRSAELLAYARAARVGFSLTVARCFAFVGPYLPLDSGFAVGNFIRDAINAREIIVNGDGSPRRTYMYASDMAAWLWSIAVEGRPGRPYNVGSDHVVTIAQLARLVASSAGGDVAVKIRGDNGRVGVGNSYVPDISRANAELGLTVKVGLEEALARTVSWHRFGLKAHPSERAPS